MAWENGCSSSIRGFDGWSYEEDRRMAEWQGMMPEGVLFVKVMTDEQLEVLRRQISIYATICEQLVEMHRAFTSQQESLAGMRLGDMYCNPSVSAEVRKITARQRWTPTPMQLQILESIFKQGNGTPSKQKIAEITSELSNHGQASEVKVYNWFQNKRARSKKKQAALLPNHAESETEAEIESPNWKKPKSDKVSYHEEPLHPENNITEGMHNSDDIARSSGTQTQMSFFENPASYPRISQLMGKIEIPFGFNAFQTGQGYNTPG